MNISAFFHGGCKDEQKTGLIQTPLSIKSLINMTYFFYPKWSHRLSKIIETFKGKGSYFALVGQNPAAYTRKAGAALRAQLTLPQSG